MKTFSIVGLVLMGLLVEKRQTSATTSEATKATTPTTTTTSAPTLEYACFMNGTVTFNTSNLNGTFTALAVGQNHSLGQNQSCSAPISVINGFDPIVTLNDCNSTQPITIYLTKDTLYMKRIIGGKGFQEYKLSCTVPNGGINASVSKILTVKEITSPPMQTNYFIPSPLSMTISPNSAEIGDTLTVTITEDFSEKFYILPTNCTAASGSKPKQGVMLLQNGTSLDKEVLSNFTVTKKGESTATLYAFRFIDSETVNFECIVFFCGTKNCVNGAYDAAPAPAGKRRRRAAVEIGHGEKYQVSASFRVVDPEEVQPTSSQSVVRFHPTLTTFLVFLASVAARRFNRECLF